MPIKLDLDVAEHRLRRAVQWANSDQAVPDEWTETTELVAAGSSRTLVAGLGAAILAKATNANIDPLSIKPEDSRPRSFAIRSLCEDVLVPISRGGQHPAFHLGTRGPQPMNNQPYFRYSHLDDVDRHRAGETLDQLRSALRDLDALTKKEALAALAAYVRSRTKAEETYQSLINREVPSSVELTQLLDALDGFLDPDSAGVNVRFGCRPWWADSSEQPESKCQLRVFMIPLGVLPVIPMYQTARIHGGLQKLRHVQLISVVLLLSLIACGNGVG